MKYLALRTGHEFVRINNHAHTDVQEYLGTYVSNSMGNLVFQEGPLVTAVRKGQWVVRDPHSFVHCIFVTTWVNP